MLQRETVLISYIMLPHKHLITFLVIDLAVSALVLIWLLGARRGMPTRINGTIGTRGTIGAVVFD